MISRKARETIAAHSLIESGDTVLACVSGGADSMALLAFLHQVQQEGTFGRLCVCHVNHLLRGAESFRDEKFVLDACKERGLVHYLLRCDVAKKAARTKQSVELCAREVRYAFFEKIARQIGGEVKIATAHTLNDNAETVLFRLARGSALGGLCGIPVRRGRIIRPLLDCTREEVEAYCAQQRIAYVVDSSNLEDAYARNRLRHRVMPELINLNPGFYTTFSKNLVQYRADADYLNSQSALAYMQLKRGMGLDAQGLVRLAPALGGRVAALYLKKRGVEVNAGRVADLLAVAGGNARSCELGRDKIARVEAGVLTADTTLQQKSPPSFPAVEAANGADIFGKYRLKVWISSCNPEKNKNFSEKGFIIALDYDTIKGTLHIRQRQTGDRISPAGRGVTKTLKKLLCESGVPVPQRAFVAVVCDNLPDGTQKIAGLIGPGICVTAGEYAAGSSTSTLVFMQLYSGETQTDKS